VNGTIDDIGRPIPTTRKITLNIIFAAQRQASSTSNYCFEIDNLFAGSIINFTNTGAICGKGGVGGHGGGESNPTVGSDGGPALRINLGACTVNINNGGGFIKGGGGGGGGGGGSVHIVEGAPQAQHGGGGGGGGAGGGAAGFGEFGDTSSGADGSPGTSNESGVGGAGGQNPTTVGDGGAGGAYGAAGATGGGGGSLQPGRAGGSAGNAVVYTVATTVNWLSGNDGTHIKGSIVTG
jgi:hypothetical protein